MQLSTLRYCLSRWRFSVQRPAKRAYRRDEEKAKRWVESEFPGISKRAKAEKAEVFLSDKTGVQNTANYAKGYAPISKTTVVRIESKKMKINIRCFYSWETEVRIKTILTLTN
jgi:hypothetical protein